MRQQDLLEIAQSPDRGALCSTLVRVAKSLGFDRVGIFLAIDRPGDRPFVEMVSNTPPAFLERSRERGPVRDPVIRHMKRSHRPIVYDRSTYEEHAAGDLWEEQAPYGFKTGIALALHLPEGRHVAIGFDREHALPNDERARLRMIGGLHLMAAFSTEAAVKLLGANVGDDLTCVRLTPREREVLHWTAAGKSTWVIGTILALSESAVNFHLRNAMCKLKCSSKHVAAYRAATLGLIWP